MKDYSYFCNLPHPGSSKLQAGWEPMEWVKWEVRVSVGCKCTRQSWPTDWAFESLLKHSFLSVLYGDFCHFGKHWKDVCTRGTLRKEHFQGWCYCMDSGQTTSFFPATLVIFADRWRIPAAAAIRIDHGKGWLAWLGWGAAQLASIMPLKCFLSSF